MDINRREYSIEMRFDDNEDSDFVTLKKNVKATEMVLKYIYESYRGEKAYRFSAYVTGMYRVGEYPQIGKRTFTSDSKNMPYWILRIALEEAPKWFGENANVGTSS
ncbi:hypothetical protein SEA_EVY_173 [Streptomyces phage Evy]|uniref:Uncharacterized protein n=1 Tax=Streptomyces phage Evy TaxID=2588514 RepID=A0A514DK57_9CAUD|nr:hypothetical protein KNU67_gp121 [Streptomyces phage Evy]QDH94011.1 hypothetical protein SEA_EVY_173 [Streptomyces phage Evy]